ncbi:hypothetical protein P3S68_007741 [Capsicum galapagoense]
MEKSTIFRRVKDETIRAHSNSVKPQLTEENKKVMFMAAVARPRFDENEIELFSGKLGIFPFVVKEPAKQNRKSRTTGTMETKPIQSVTKEITRACLIEKVLPTIRAKWPASDSNSPIFVQQDNARPHIGNNDLKSIEAAQQDGFDISSTSTMI